MGGFGWSGAVVVALGSAALELMTMMRKMLLVLLLLEELLWMNLDSTVLSHHAMMAHRWTERPRWALSSW